MPELRLVTSQQAWSRQALQILQNYPFYIDTSTLGAGKTVLACWLALRLKLKLFVVAPLSILSTWEDESAKYRVPLVEVMTYAKLQGLNKRGQPTHPYLEIKVSEDKKTYYQPSKFFLSLLNQGLLVIFDECYMLKNISNRSDAAYALTGAIHQKFKKTSSRYGLLSNTLLDKERLIVNFLHLLHFFTKKGDRIEEMTRFVNLAARLDPEKTNEILRDFSGRNSATTRIYQLYIQVVKFAISGGMDRPRTDDIVRDVKSGFYYITEKEKYYENLKLLSYVMGYDTTQNRFIKEAIMDKFTLALITTSIQEIEYTKCYDIVRMTKTLLKEKPTCKVIICLHYVESQKRVLSLLPPKYTVLMNGQTPSRDRRDIVREFNEPNLSVRVLILSTRINAGLSLHDIDGNYPRIMFITPTFHMIDLAQTAGRIDRLGVRSKVTVRMFYGLSEDNVKLEHVLLDRIRSKTQVIKEMVNYAGAEKNILPGEYTDILEDEETI